MNLQKHKPYRNRQLLDLAHRVQECQIQLEGCPGFVEDGCEPVHSDQQRHGKGMRQKSGDQYHAAGCHWCHVELSNLPREERDLAWQKGHERTFELYWNNEWLKVN